MNDNAIHSAPAMRRILFLLLLINFSLRLAVALYPLDHIDEVTIPDDAYLSLTVARNIASGNGATYGGEYTSGIQPLYVLLMAPVFYFSPDQYDLPVHAALIILSLFDTLAVMLLFLLIAQYSTYPITPILASLAWIVNPLTINIALNGLETAIAGFFILLILTLYKKYVLDKPDRQPIYLFLFGAVCGLGILARIDTVLLVGVLGATMVWSNRRDVKLSIKPLLIIGAGIAVTYGPWVIYSYVHSGDLYPVSGKAVRFLGLERSSMSSSFFLWTMRTTLIGIVEVINNNKILLLVAGVLVFPATLLTSSFYRTLKETMPVVSRAYFVAGTLYQLHLVFVVAFWFVERTIHPVAIISIAAGSAFYIPLLIQENTLLKKIKQLSGILIPYIIFSIILFAAYTQYIFAVWYFDRYLYPLNILFFLFFAIILELLFPLFRTRRIATLFGGAIGAIIIALNVSNNDFLKLYNHTELNTYGYRNLGLWAQKEFPEGTVIGSCQTGSLGYFADHITVINLDGVVNKESYEALIKKEIVPYIKSNKIEYIVDWRSNYSFLSRVSKEPLGESIIFLKTIDGFTSWNHQWNLYSVNYGDPP